ncbi:MAG: phosphatase PAP2 family protein [Ilumatobacter sp.]|uniref:phosphatase PAP2 family protein n=1 Tax=Ilumatobacter sp. TaxID=1967498 RepID=UPI003C746ED4
MIVLVILAIVVSVAAVLVGARSMLSGREPVDVDRGEQWLLDRTPGWIARPLNAVDRRIVGGATVGVSFVVVAAAAIAVGWIFSGIDDGSGIAQWDAAAAEWGRDNATDTSTTILDIITGLGSTIPLIIAMVLLGVYHFVRYDDRGPALYLAVVGIGVTGLNNGLKLVVDRDRPDIAQLASHAGSSFPSGHSAAAAACWAALVFVVTRRSTQSIRIGAGILAVSVAVAVAATRVLLGVHWVSDVVAGVLVGWTWFLLITIAVGGRALRLGEPSERISESTAAPTSPLIDRREESPR